MSLKIAHFDRKTEEGKYLTVHQETQEVPARVGKLTELVNLAPLQRSKSYTLEGGEEFDFPRTESQTEAVPISWDLLQDPQNFLIWSKAAYRRIRNVLPLYVVLLALALYQWFRSLSNCGLDLAECVAMIKQQAPELMLRVAKFAFLTFVLLHLSLSQTDLLAKYLGAACVAITYIYIWLTSQSFTAQDHSQVNMALAFVLFGLFNLIYGIGFALYKLWKKSKLLVGLFCLSIVGVIALIYIFRVKPSCKHLNDSLHKDYTYSEVGTECKWVKPQICWHYAVKGLYRPVFWGRSTCSQYSTDLSTHKEIAATTGLLAYPLSTQVDPAKRIYLLELQHQIMSRLSSATQADLDNSEKEVFIDFRTKPKGEVVIKLRDLTKNPKTSFLPHDKEHMNVLHLFVDTVSRQRFFRRFKKTSSILKHYHFTENRKIRAYEFFRFHALAPWTSTNLASSVYGDFDNLDMPKKRIETFAKQRGYVTGFTNNLCQSNEMDHDYKDGYSTNQKFEDPQAPHHEMVQLACDYNNLPKENGMSFFFSPGPYTASRKCFLQQDLSQYSFEYALQFFRTYRQERKFFTLRLIDPHEFSEEVAGFLDDPLSRFLDTMIAEGHLDNTVVYFNSDHGDHINFIFQGSESFKAEVFNPMLFVLLPENHKDGLGTTVLANTQKLLTHRDLFATDMKYLGFGEDSQVRGQSILQEQVQNRPCEHAKISDCMCH